MDVTKTYEFIGSGAMYVTKPYKIIGFGTNGCHQTMGIYKFWGRVWYQTI